MIDKLVWLSSQDGHAQFKIGRAISWRRYTIFTKTSTKASLVYALHKLTTSPKREWPQFMVSTTTLSTSVVVTT